MTRKRSGGTGTSSDRTTRRNARIAEAGGKVTTVRFDATSVVVIGRAALYGFTQDQAVNAALAAWDDALGYRS